MKLYKEVKAKPKKNEVVEVEPKTIKVYDSNFNLVEVEIGGGYLKNGELTKGAWDELLKQGYSMINMKI